MIAPPALAQTSRVVSGTVRDSAGAPIVGAVVAVVDTNETAYHATTNAQGRFTLRYQAVDTARFVVSHLQYVRFWRRLDSVAIAGEQSEIDVRLGTPRGQRWGPNAPERPLDIHDDTIPDTELEDVARAAGLSLLRERKRTGGDAEIRLAIGGGIFVPENLLILRRRAGRVSGERWFWWGPVASRESSNELKWWRKHAAEYGCPNAPPRRAAQYSDANREEFVMFVCRSSFGREPDWTAIWRRLDSLGVWTLPDEDELPRFVSSVDGFVLTAEMFDGTHYRLIRHANPDPASSPEATRAAQIARLVSGVTGQAVGNKKP